MEASLDAAIRAGERRATGYRIRELGIKAALIAAGILLWEGSASHHQGQDALNRSVIECAPAGEVAAE